MKKKDLESYICPQFSKISGVNGGLFRSSYIIAPSGDIDKNQLKDAMLKNEDGLTEDEKASLDYLEKIMGNEEYNKYKSALLKNPEDLTDDEKKMLERVSNIYSTNDLNSSNKDIKYGKLSYYINADENVESIDKEDIASQIKIQTTDGAAVTCEGSELDYNDDNNIIGNLDSASFPIAMGTTITADGFDFSFPVIEDVPTNPSIVTPLGLAATIFTAIVAHADSVGQTPEEEAIEEYNRRTITEMAKGIPNKWPWSALPNTGSYPFVPPTDKAGNPISKKDRDSGGIIDQDGNVWTRDKQAERVGNGHWDVKLKNGDHLNVNGNDVDNSGDINHGKGKEN